MSGFLTTLAGAPSDRVLFVDGDVAVTAGQVRAAAKRAAARAPAGELFLHTDSAALLCAGLLAGALLKRTVAVLPHVQPDYLREIGAGDLLTDAGPDAPLAVGQEAEAPFDLAAEAPLVFFTSGSTGQPKQAPKLVSQLDAEARHWMSVFAGLDHAAGTVSHQHIYGLTFRVILPVMAGWTAADRQAFTWESFTAQLTPKTLAVTSPAHLSRFPPELLLPNGSPGVILSAGQVLPWAAATDARQRFGKPVKEILGSTELGAFATRLREEDLTPWSPLPGMAIRPDADGVLNVRSAFTGGEPQATGDVIEQLSDGRFHLRGRADRIVKIDGKRVSLARVEETLKALPGIIDVAVAGVQREAGPVLGAAIVLAPEQGAALARAGTFRFSRQLRRDLAAQLEPAERPKRWRFVGRIPQNAQGKRRAPDIAALFEDSYILQALEAATEVLADDKARVSFLLKPDLRWFEGHFPGRPVLAGVAQCHLAVRLGEELWGFLPDSFQIARLKFRRMIQPGEQVALELVRDAAKGRLTFSFTTDGEPASEGVIGA